MDLRNPDCKIQAWILGYPPGNFEKTPKEETKNARTLYSLSDKSSTAPFG